MANILEKEWHSYFVQLNETEKKSVLQMLKAFLKSRRDNTERISIKQYNKEIDEAMRQVKMEKYIPMRTW
ncbi:MAG: hypothetical protein M3139_04435 [Bacteroidota bacterium]|nr:hypothetical protein [Bacteroidota bacterium]